MSMSKSLAPGPAKSDKSSSEAATQWYEVLTRNQDGQRTVHRLHAVDQAAAVAEVESGLDPGIEVIGSAPAGHNLGSSDGINDLVDTT
jgi:hypothetical protein